MYLLAYDVRTLVSPVRYGKPLFLEKQHDHVFSHFRSIIEQKLTPKNPAIAMTNNLRFKIANYFLIRNALRIWCRAYIEISNIGLKLRAALLCQDWDYRWLPQDFYYSILTIML